MTPTSLDELLDALNREWALGVARLTEFERLFGKAERVAFLNRLGGEFFADVQQILWDDLLLRVTRLTDHPQTGRKGNLTVRRLPGLCEHDKFPGNRVQEQVDAAVKAAGFARSHRNLRISHKDLAYAIGGSRLPTTTLDQVQGAMDAVHAVLQTVNLGHRGANLNPEVSVGPRVEAFMGRAEFLVDAVLFIQELLEDASGQAPAWDDDVSQECLLRLGGAPSPENVRRLVNLRLAAGWLRTE